jgi:hypothetical protein
MAARHAILGPGLRAAVLLAATIAIVAPGRAAAEVRIVEARADALVIEAHDATVRDVLDALAAKQIVDLRATDALSRTVSGTYSGPPRRVLSHILDGYDHVIQSTSSGLVVNVFGAVDGAKTMVSVARGAIPAPTRTPKVSSNLDLDEEKAAQPTPTASVPANPPPRTPVIARVPPTLTTNARAVPASRISTNVDLDEEQTSR